MYNKYLLIFVKCLACSGCAINTCWINRVLTMYKILDILVFNCLKENGPKSPCYVAWVILNIMMNIVSQGSMFSN